MAHVNFILQGKGGVGKSLIAAVLAQFVADKSNKEHSEQLPPICIDTDPVNSTFSGYKCLNVQHLEIMDGDEISSRKFDTLIDVIHASSTNADQPQAIIVDNGASSFVPLSSYLISQDVPKLLTEMGHTVTIHTVITGGQALNDTLVGFGSMADQYPEPCAFVVWLNPYWGPIEVKGKPFEALKIYSDHKSRVTGLIKIPDFKKDTFGRDFSEMLKQRHTFTEAIADTSLPIMERHRLKQVKQQLFEQIAAINLF